MGGQKFRFWVFTIFDLSFKFNQHPDLRYICFQHEITPSTNKEHIQGYLELNKQLGIKGVKSILNCNSVHLEHRKGNQDQAIEYCCKTDTSVPNTFFEWGIKGGSQGKRTDLFFFER